VDPPRPGASLLIFTQFASESAARLSKLPWQITLYTLTKVVDMSVKKEGAHTGNTTIKKEPRSGHTIGKADAITQTTELSL